jgi:DNA-binding transcriptional ArsR family regulator
MHKRKVRKHSHQREVSPALIDALNHPIRREILRVLNSGEEGSPAELTKLIAAPLTYLSYHVGVLAKLAVLRRTHIEKVRGAEKSTYRSMVANNELVASILGGTAGDDEGLKRSR